MPELIDYYANDKNTRVIALHIEGIRRPREFYSSLRAACARKHVVILKAGSGSATPPTASPASRWAPTREAKARSQRS